MKKIIVVSVLIISCTIFSCKTYKNVETNTAATQPVVTDIYQFKIVSLDGDTINFSGFRGKKILVVNTASNCGYTPQYQELEELYNKYKEKLVIVGFPTNDFGEQEPGSNEEIKEFCSKTYGVTFPMSQKISVKGDIMAPIFQWLTSKERNGVMDAEIKWNFNKFLIDEHGHLVTKFETKVTPMSQEIVSKLE